MSLVTNLIQAEISSLRDNIDGKTVSRPSPIHSDGLSVTYSVDVDIGEEGPINENGDLGNMVLYNVPIAAGNRSLIYAEIGSPVTLRRTATGQWEVYGFSKTYPNLYTIVCVEVPTYCFRIPTEDDPGEAQFHPPILGTPITYDQELRILTYEELGLYDTYGDIPYGAAGVFVGGEFQSWRLT